MTNKEITLLSYLADALYQRPQEYKEIHENFRCQHGRSFLYTFWDIVRALEGAFGEDEPVTKEDCKRLIKKMSVSADEDTRRASVVLSWGQDNSTLR